MECYNWPKSDKIIVADNLNAIGSPELVRFLAHALCLSGEASFVFNGDKFKFQNGDLLIVRKGELVESLKTSQDFQVTVIYIDKAFIGNATPLTNYGTKGSIALFQNPVIRLTAFQFEMCKRDFENVIHRFELTCFRFYEEALRCAVQLMIIDFFDFHARLNSESSLTPQFASIMTRFLELLETGVYRAHREVTYYASELCVSAKYLSEVCKKVSGHSANFWINRYTALDISRQLRNKNLTIVQIADMFNFSSPAYFSRYVQNNLGMRPSDYRE